MEMQNTSCGHGSALCAPITLWGWGASEEELFCFWGMLQGQFNGYWVVSCSQPSA